MKQKILHEHHFQALTALMLADFLVAMLVNPVRASAPWLIIGYVLLGVTLFVIASCLSNALKACGKVVHRTSQRLFRYGAAILVLLMGLQSIGQLTAKDVLTLVPLAIIAYLYFGYGKNSTADST